MTRASISLIATLLACMILVATARISAAQGGMEATSSENANQKYLEDIQKNLEESRYLPIPQTFEDMDVLLNNHVNEVRGFTVLGH